MPIFTPYRTDVEIAEVVRKFESCEYKKDEFPHFRHLAVIAWYLSHLSREESLDRMRIGLLRFTRHHGVNAYHETITQFWVRVTADYLRFRPSTETLADRINILIEKFASKEVLFDYYTRERVMTEEARQGWVAPDLRDFEVSGQQPESAKNNSNPPGGRLARK
jgi:hypothetical protein